MEIMNIKGMVRGAALIFGLLVLNYNVGFSQLDSASVTLSFTVETDPMDSTQMVDALNISTTVNDIDYLGEVVVTVYDLSTGYPVAMVKVSKQEFLDENLVTGDTALLQLLDIDSASSYRVETIVRNYQGGQLPTITEEINN